MAVFRQETQKQIEYRRISDQEPDLIIVRKATEEAIENWAQNNPPPAPESVWKQLAWAVAVSVVTAIAVLVITTPQRARVDNELGTVRNRVNNMEEALKAKDREAGLLLCNQTHEDEGCVMAEVGISRSQPAGSILCTLPEHPMDGQESCDMIWIARSNHWLQPIRTYENLGTPGGGSGDGSPAGGQAGIITMHGPDTSPTFDTTPYTHQLKLKFSDRCWASIAADEGKVTARTFMPNEEFQQTFTRAVIRDGCPGKVYMTLDGQPVTPKNLAKHPDKIEEVILP